MITHRKHRDPIRIACNFSTAFNRFFVSSRLYIRVYIYIYVFPIGRRRARPPIMEIRNIPDRDNLRHLSSFRDAII